MLLRGEAVKLSDRLDTLNWNSPIMRFTLNLYGTMVVVKWDSVFPCRHIFAASPLENYCNIEYSHSSFRIITIQYSLAHWTGRLYYSRACTVRETFINTTRLNTRHQHATRQPAAPTTYQLYAP